MFIVVGLGNPGEQYNKTRHNVGFMAVDRVNERANGDYRKGRGAYFLSKIQIQSSPVLLVKPTTYMNLSGRAVQEVLSFYKIDDLSGLLIVVDDFNIPFGTLRMRPSGSAGGQKGLVSIIESLQTKDFSRLRIGIGNQFKVAKSFVLSPFNRSEQKYLPDVIDGAADAIESFIVNGITKSMNIYNKNLID